MSCGSSISGSLKGRPNDWTLESLKISENCQFSSCTFNGPDDIIAFEKTGESFSLKLTHGENGLSLFVLDENFNAVTVTDGNGITLCKGQNVDANGDVVGNNESVGEIFTYKYRALPNGQYYAVVQGGCLNSENFKDDYQLELECEGQIDIVPDCHFGLELPPSTSEAELEKVVGSNSYVYPNVT